MTVLSRKVTSLDPRGLIIANKNPRFPITFLDGFDFESLLSSHNMDALACSVFTTEESELTEGWCFTYEREC